jgi:phosphonate transport system ATP-binding protein
MLRVSDRESDVLSLTFDALTKRFPDGTLALDGVSVEVEPGDGVVLLGHNGSGKSTLLRCAVGLERATSGRILLGGVDMTTARGRRLREVRRRVGYVFQHFNLVGSLSVFHNVLHGSLGRSRGPWCWFPATAPQEERLRALACLERVGLGHLAGRRADQLSGGQKQRVALARTLMQEPDMILADEPVASLDPRAGREVMDLLWDLARERGLTVVCTLHQLDLAWEYANRVVGLRNGRVVLDDRKGSIHRSTLEGLYNGEQSVSQPTGGQG